MLCAQVRKPAWRGRPDVTHSGFITRRQPHYRLHQSGSGSQNVPVGKDSCVAGGDGERECAPARPAGACGRVLRDRAGAVHAVVVSGSAALSAGRNPVAGGTGGGSQGGWEFRYLAGANQTGMGASTATARRSGQAGRGGGDKGRLV